MIKFKKNEIFIGKEDKPKIFSIILNPNEADILDSIHTELISSFESMVNILQTELREYWVKERNKIFKQRLNYLQYLTEIYAPNEYKNMINPKQPIYCEALKKLTFICKEDNYVHK